MTVAVVPSRVQAPAPEPKPPVDPKPAGHPIVRVGKVGVLLVNLGTPDGTDYWSIRRYLSEFLSDRRVIELSPWLWQPILQGVLLTLRPQKTGRAYQVVWCKERNESPLKTITRAQAEGLGRRFGDTVEVDWAMRYGSRPIDSRLVALKSAGCDRILVVPLYPQYSATTTASVSDAVNRHMARERTQPALRFLPAYHDQPAYIEALARTVRKHLASLPWRPEVILASFHGLPEDSLTKGDPYHCQCHKTVRLLREALGLSDQELRLSFQSRFGPKQWLKPYSVDVVEDLGRQGIKRLAVISPGFSADCLETLEEIKVGLAETFEEHGGEQFSYIPCLNDSDTGLDMLEALVRQELGGWIA
jgi:ferrochelatase